MINYSMKEATRKNTLQVNNILHNMYSSQRKKTRTISSKSKFHAYPPKKATKSNINFAYIIISFKFMFDQGFALKANNYMNKKSFTM